MNVSTFIPAGLAAAATMVGCALAGEPVHAKPDAGVVEAAASAQGAHAFTFTGIAGDPLPMNSFAGRPVLVVNTASLCGFTRQYADLQAVYETYQDRGLVVVGVPSDDFGGQEPGSNGEIKKFCETNFNVKFPLTEKVAVRGATAHPFYQWAAQTLGKKNAPKWNFHKYLVAPDGSLAAAFASSVKPTDADIVSAIEAQL